MRRLFIVGLFILFITSVLPTLGSAQARPAAGSSLGGGWNVAFQTKPGIVYDLLLAVEDGKVVGALNDKRIEGRFADGTLTATVLTASNDPWKISIEASPAPDGSLVGTEISTSVDDAGQPIRNVVPFVATRQASGLTGLSGKWRTAIVKGTPFKTFSTVMLNLDVNGGIITGTATMGGWPGVCDISDGRINGDEFSFVASSGQWSSSGYPRITLNGTINGDDMAMTFTWGFVGGGGRGGPVAGSTLQLIGKRRAP